MALSKPNFPKGTFAKALACGLLAAGQFQHMSNAGLSNHNPGLNLHMFGVSYRF